MKLRDVIFLWEDDELSKNFGKFAVVNDGGAFDYSNSVGDVFGGWSNLTDVERAVGTLALQNWVMRQGLDWNVVHSECLKIDEYADWCRDETGPFRRAYGCCQGAEIERLDE